MNKEREILFINKLSTNQMGLIALVAGIFPLMTLIPVFLGITLAAIVQYVWAGINMFCILVGLSLSIVYIKRKKVHDHIGKVALTINGFWTILVAVILLTALIYNLP